MAKDISQSTAKHGMNKTDHLDFIKSHEYTHAKNSNLQDLQDGGMMLQSEASNLLTVDFGEYKVIGARNIYGINKTIYFLFNEEEGRSRISLVSNREIDEDKYDEVIDCPGCQSKSIMTDPLEDIQQEPDREEEVIIDDECNGCLNFSLENPIKYIVVKEEAIGLVVYFTDYNNEQRVINLDKKDWYTDNTDSTCGEEVGDSEDDCLDCSKLRLHTQHSPIIAKAKSIQGSGNLKRATYQVLIAYVNEEGLEISEYQAVTQPTAAFDQQNRTLTQEELIGGKTDISIKIEIDHIDEGMDYYKVVVVKRNDEGYKYYIEGIFNTTNKEIILTTEDNKNLIDREMLYLTIPVIKKAGILAESNNMLIQGNVETEADWNLQPVVNFIGSFAHWITMEATEHFYADGVNSANSKTNLRDEVTAKSIRFLTDTGYITPLYPLISRPPHEEEIGNKNKDSIEYKSVQQGNVTCDLEGREQVWQYENTAENLGKAEEYVSSGVTAPRRLEFFCQVKGIEATGEGTVEIKLEEYDNKTFKGLRSFINSNREFIKSYEGNEPGILKLKELLLPDEPYQNCRPTDVLSTCNDIEEEDLNIEDVTIAEIEEEEFRFVESEYPSEYPESSPPRYTDLYFVDTSGEEVEDILFRDTFMHYGVSGWGFYRSSMRDHWQFPKREIYTNNFTCINSDILPYYETSVRGEDQAYLMDYNVETGKEETTLSTEGDAKVTIGGELVEFSSFKAVKEGNRITIDFKKELHKLKIVYEEPVLGVKQLETSNSNSNKGRYTLDDDPYYETTESLGGEGQVETDYYNEEAGKVSGTFSFKAYRYETGSEAVIEEIIIEDGEFNNIDFEDRGEEEQSDEHYTAGISKLLDEESGRYFDLGLDDEGANKEYEEYYSRRKVKLIQTTKPFGGTRFYRKFHDKSLWFKVEIPEDEDLVIEMTKTSEKTCEMRNKKEDFVGAVSMNMFRVSFWEDCESKEPFWSTIINEPKDSSGDVIKEGIDIEMPENEGLMRRIITSARRRKYLKEEEGISDTILNRYDYSTDNRDGSGDPLLESKKSFYITVEAPIYASPKNERYMLAPPCQAFSLITRAIEYGRVDVEFSGILVDKNESYLTNCTIDMPDSKDCNPKSFEHGEFSYVESRKEYPDNQELYNSSTLKIEPIDLSSDYTVREKFEGWYTNGAGEDGKYLMNSNSNFSCKSIRHFKYPDNEYAPFLFEYSLPEFSDASIYPLAFTINEEMVTDFLDIAVKNELIDREQRDSIVGYEIFTGSREGNKSVQAKGILFDMYKYEVGEKTVQFPNFPYNDLGDNTLFLDEDDNPIRHPETGESNSNFTMMSPDIYNKGGVWASEMSVDSFQYGSSNTTFPEIKGHPKWVILGKKAYSTANLLAWTETVVDLTINLLEGIEAYRIAVGTSSAFNAPGIILHIAATAMALTQNIFIKRGSYKLQWIQSIRDLGTPYNFAHRSAGVGKYNYLGKNKGIQDNKLRGLSSREIIGEGLNTVTDRMGHIHHINNIDREKSLHITLGSDKDSGESYALRYPPTYSSYDNRNKRFGQSSRFTLGEVDRKGGPEVETLRNIASPYITLKNYMPEQYGEIDSIKWLPTSYYGDLKNKKTQPTIYVGDSYISRFSEIRKVPLYLVDAMNQASLTTFEYNKNSNIGEKTKFYVDYEVGGEERIQSLTMPEIRSNYNLDCEEGEEGFYLKPPSKFYMQYYGIVNYMVESDINANYRYAKEGIENSFYPEETDYVRLTEQVERPIRTPNTMYYDRTFSGKPIRTAINLLGKNYSKEVEELKAKGKGLMMQSEADNDEFSSTDPWTMYRPLNMYKAPTSAGDLVGLDGVESSQIIARFERGFSIINAVDTIQRMTTKDAILGKGGIFGTRPMEFHSTDAGYAGSQNYNLLKTEFGHIWVDAKAGQVFVAVIGGNGMPQLQEITSKYGDEDTKMSKWFKNHLPFKVLRTGLEVDTDNPYNGIGIAMVYDSRNKRLLLTKKDYIIKDKSLGYQDKHFRLTEGPEVDTIRNVYTEDGWDYEGIENFQLKFTREIERTFEDCLNSLKFVVAYRQNGNIEGDPNPPPCYGGHNCNRAVFDIKGNGVKLGQINLNNAGGDYDHGDRFPDYDEDGEGYIGQHYKDRYDEFSLDTETVQMLAEKSEEGSITLKFECACIPGENCEPKNCHDDMSWMRIYKDGEKIYDGCPIGNILEIVPCVSDTTINREEKLVDLPKVEITGDKFEDVSWTISFYFEYGRWGSFYDFIPNYYIPQKNYFQSGINTEKGSSMWSHHLTKRSFQVFYGKAYDWEIEVPFETKGANRYLEDVEYRLDALRYQDNYDYYQNEEISFDEAVIYNNTTSSGKLELVNKETLAQQRNYPKRVNTTTQRILQTNKEGTWAFNYFYNRVKDLKNRVPLWRHDRNQIDKEVNRESVSMYGKRQLDRLRGQNFLLNLKSKETQHQKAVKIIKTNENLYK